MMFRVNKKQIFVTVALLLAIGTTAWAARTVRYPSGATFNEVMGNLHGGVDYEDTAANGDVPLIDLRNRTGTKLSNNFNAGEFQTNDGARYARISDDLITKLQRLRSNTGRSITVNSGYRHPQYNEDVAGSGPGSQHVAGKAADIVISGLTPIKMAEEAIKVFGCQNLGIGLYGSYIHVDVRSFGRNSWAHHTASMSESQFDSWVADKCRGSQPPSSGCSRPTLRLDDRSSHVQHAQLQLLKVGGRTARYILNSGGADSHFGSGTKDAAISYQKIVFPNDSSQWDGIIGGKTWANLGCNSNDHPAGAPVPPPR